MLWQQQYDILYTLSPCLKTCAKETGMARSDYDIINLSLEHELNEWLAERGYAGLVDNRNRLACYPQIAGQLLYKRFQGCAEHGIQ